MDVDFSNLNLQYLIQAHDLALRVPDCVPELLGVSKGLAGLITQVEPADLNHLQEIRLPLLIPRQEVWWWQRLIDALRQGRIEEIDAVLTHAGLLACP